jgi:hypothetical protein
MAARSLTGFLSGAILPAVGIAPSGRARLMSKRARIAFFAQCLNLEQEFDHDASKLCILGFEAFK